MLRLRPESNATLGAAAFAGPAILPRDPRDAAFWVVDLGCAAGYYLSRSCWLMLLCCVDCPSELPESQSARLLCSSLATAVDDLFNDAGDILLAVSSTDSAAGVAAD